MIGSLIAIFIFQNLNEYILTLIIGYSILFLTWVPINKLIKHGLANDLICGLLAGVAGIFIGANGPIVTAFMRLKNLSPESLVANPWTGDGLSAFNKNYIVYYIILSLNQVLRELKNYEKKFLLL